MRRWKKKGGRGEKRRWIRIRDKDVALPTKHKILIIYILDRKSFPILQFRSVQSLSCVRFFATPWTATNQASLSITNSKSLLKLMPIKSVNPSNHLILCRPLLLPLSIIPSIRVFPMSQFFTSGKQSIEVSASVLLMNSQKWFPLG